MGFLDFLVRQARQFPTFDLRMQHEAVTVIADGSRITQVAPYLAYRTAEFHDWDQIKLLTVKINRLGQWYRPGLLSIGDAAHAMSPAWAVGINLPIQDATATARILANPLLENQVTEDVLAAVQHRREFPTQVTQFLQVNAHRAMDRFLFQNPGPFKAPGN